MNYSCLQDVSLLQSEKTRHMLASDEETLLETQNLPQQLSPWVKADGLTYGRGQIVLLVIEIDARVHAEPSTR